MTPSESPTATDPRFNLGVDSDKLLLVGHSVQAAFGWDTPARNADGLPTCEWVPADFSGYTPEAAVLDADDNVLATMTVTTAVDAFDTEGTGTYSIFLAGTDVDEALKAAAVRWRLSIDSGTTKVALIYARFKVS